MFATQVAARQMKKQGHGSIIVIASTAGLMGVANRMAYSTSKGALVIMCKSIAAELAGTNVRHQLHLPGYGRYAVDGEALPGNAGSRRGQSAVPRT